MTLYKLKCYTVGIEKLASLVEEEIRNQEEHEKQKIGHRRIDRQGEVGVGFLNNL